MSSQILTLEFRRDFLFALLDTVFGHSKLKISVLGALFMLVQCSVVAQLNVATDKVAARYGAGEQMNFIVTSDNAGTATYIIKHDQDSQPISTGTVNLSANIPKGIPFKLDVPGFVFCEIRQGNDYAIAGTAFSPLEVQPFEPAPNDFDAFWDAKKAELAAVPINPQLTFYDNHPYSETHRFELGSVDGRKVYGYITIPNGSGPFPAVVTMPSFGNDANLVQPEVALAERAGVISIALSIVNVPPDEEDPNGYQPNIINEADGIFYKYAMMAGIRAIDYLFTHPDFDGENVGVMGVSQGGGLAMLLAGIDQRVKLLACSNPSHSQHAGLKYGRASAFPYYLNQSIQAFGSSSHEVETLAAAKYYDAVYCAQRFKGPAYVLTGYKDDVNPPETVFASFNQMSGSKILVHSRDLNHLQNPDEYWSGRLDFLRKHFPSTLNAPWPWTSSTTGYFAHAGDDQSISSSTVDLNGSIQMDGAENFSFPVEWRLVEGPAPVTFSNKNSKNTSVTFSTNGTYTLSFNVFDETTLAGQGKFVTICDYLTINVNDSGGSSGGDLFLTCPADIEVTADPNATTAFVEWPSPVYWSSCAGGDIFLNQTEGQPNWTYFPIGETTISYEATDDCSNSKTCSFLIKVESGGGGGGTGSGFLNIEADRTNGRYAAGEAMNFLVTANTSGSADYILKYDNDSPPIETGTVNVVAGQTTNIPFSLATPGTVICEISNSSNSAVAAAVFSPFQIEPLEPEPSDFDAFWNARKAELANVPSTPKVIFHQNHAYGTTFSLELDNIDGRKIYGYITVPTGAGPFPAIITLPPAGNNAGLVQPKEFMAERVGVLAVTLSIHNVPPDEEDPNGYLPDDIADAANNYYRYAVLAAIRTIDYLHTRSDFDGENIGLVGVSQGGGLAIMVGGLDDRVNLLACSNPTHGQNAGYKYDKASPYPYYVRRSVEAFGSSQHEAATVAASKYYDAMYFAKRYDGSAFVAVSYEDVVVPSATTFAIINQLAGSKVVVHSKELGHIHPEEYWDGRYDFFRKHFPAALNAPWPFTPNTTGFFANAGGDLSAQTGSLINLSGSVQQNGSEVNLPVKWELMSGPGAANFSNADNKNTNITFSNSGSYVLSFRAFDDNSMAADDQFFSISDQLIVTVSGADNIPPLANLSVVSNNVNGSFEVSVEFSEPVTGLSYNDLSITNGSVSDLNGSGQFYTYEVTPNGNGDLTISIPAFRVLDAAGNGNTASNELHIVFGQSANLTITCPQNVFVFTSNGASTTTASWADPNASTTCPNGISSILQTNGQPSGSQFQIGTTAIVYEATDNCSNVQTCSFSIIVGQGQGGGTGTDYCDSEGEEPWVEWIERVQFHTLDNSSAKENYGNFTNLSTDVEKGNNYDLLLVPGFSWLPYDEHWRVWIDFNQDFGFDDAGEMVFSQNGTGEMNGSIFIPSNSTLGPTRMRIAMHRGSFSDACEIFGLGEVEDYTVYITDGGSGGGGGGGGVDTDPPSVYISTPISAVTGVYTIEIDFTEGVTGLSDDDFKITNGEIIGSLSGSADFYTLDINPLSFGKVTVSIPPNKAFDAAGNGNIESNWLTVDFTSSNSNPCDDPINLLPFTWSDYGNGAYYLYNSFGNNVTFVSTGNSLTGKQILFAEIGFLPEPNEEYEIALEVVSHNTGPHKINLYLGNSADEELAVNLKNIAGDGEQIFTADLAGNDRFILAGQGGGAAASGAVVLTKLEIRCLGWQPLIADPNLQLEFNAAKNGRYVLLDWLARNNDVTKNYTVQRSTDGAGFSDLFTKPNTKADAMESYWEVDWKPELGDNFYRLRQTLLNGTQVFSGIKKIGFDIDINEVSLFPNPADGFININLHPYAGKSGNLQVFNQLGQQMDFIEIEKIPELTYFVKLEGYREGLYFLVINVDGNKSRTLPFMIAKPD